MSMENVLPRLTEGAVVVVPADRSEVLLAVLMAHQAGHLPVASPASCSTAASSYRSRSSAWSMACARTLPIIRTSLNSFETAVRITHIRGRLAADSQRKFDTALARCSSATSTRQRYWP